MSEYFTFHQNPRMTDEEIQSLLKGMDLQICLMQRMKDRIESCIGAENAPPRRVCETGNGYGKSGYMADVELNDYGEITAIRYDWVNP